MTLILQIAILTVLGLTLIEDLRHRAIRWWLPPVLFILLFVNTWVSENFALIEVLYNLAFTTVVLGLTILYFRLRGVDTSSFFAKKFGIGDVLFLLAISPAVPFRWFPMVFVGGLIVSILVSLYPIHSGRWKTIPLAGLLSIWIAGVFCFFQITSNSSLPAQNKTSVRVLRPEGGVYREQSMLTTTFTHSHLDTPRLGGTTRCDVGGIRNRKSFIRRIPQCGRWRTNRRS